MTDAIDLGEKLLALLDETARVTTYKSALLLAIVDRAQEHVDGDAVPVAALAERVIELYWPQTLPYTTTGRVLLQNQGATQATIVRDIASFRATAGDRSRSLSDALRTGPAWTALVERVEVTLAQWPIPRLQRPFEPFLYEFDWPWTEAGGWSARQYRDTGRAIRLRPGIARALVSLGPLLRPFITRWWTDKAALLNPDVEGARSLVEFEDFLFGRDRVALGRVAEGLLDLQHGACFYCGTRVTRSREVDHVVPWSHCGDDGLHNLVVSCRPCNNAKRATLAGARHLGELLDRNARVATDLEHLGEERRWPQNAARSMRILRAAYLDAPDERPLWTWTPAGARIAPLRADRPLIAALLAG